MPPALGPTGAWGLLLLGCRWVQRVGRVSAQCWVPGQQRDDSPLPVSPTLAGGDRPGGASAEPPPPPQAALRRFHSLSVSSDTTLDSFASLHPDEVRGGPGWGGGVRAAIARGQRAEAVAVPAAGCVAGQGPGAAALQPQHRLLGRLAHRILRRLRGLPLRQLLRERGGAGLRPGGGRGQGAGP